MYSFAEPKVKSIYCIFCLIVSLWLRVVVGSQNGFFPLLTSVPRSAVKPTRKACKPYKTVTMNTKRGSIVYSKRLRACCVFKTLTNARWSLPTFTSAFLRQSSWWNAWLCIRQPHLNGHLPKAFRIAGQWSKRLPQVAIIGLPQNMTAFSVLIGIQLWPESKKEKMD